MSVSRPVALQIDDLSKVFATLARQTITAIDNITLTIPPATVYGIVGASGAGKTTLVAMIGGDLEPTHGQIRVHGHDSRRAREATSTLIGIVRQKLTLTHPHSTPMTTLLATGLASGLSENDAALRAFQLLDDLELSTHDDLPAAKLPYAMQQKLAIACALMPDPAVLVLDEPMQHLDLAAMDRVKALCVRLAHERGKTVVAATSNPALAMALCDHVAILCHGRVVLEESVEALRAACPGTQYEITVKGALGSIWSEWFDGLTIHKQAGATVLSGTVPDQAALHGLLIRVRDLNLPLLSIRCLEPGLTEWLYANGESSD